MLNKLSKFILFLLAYLPLFILLIIRNVDNSRLCIILISIFLIIILIPTIILLIVVENISGHKEHITILDFKNESYLTFIVTYLIPFFASFNSVREWITIILLFGIILYFYMESSIFYINPLLKILFGYNIHEVEIHHKKYALLSKTKHQSEIKFLTVKKLADDVLITEE